MQFILLRIPEKLIKEINRILKKDGKLFIASPFILMKSEEPNDLEDLHRKD